MKKTILFLAMGLSTSFSVLADDLNQYEVSITNATSHHVFTPVFIATHHKGMHLFAIGQTASEGLSVQAETGDPSLLQSEVQHQAGVVDTVIGGFVPYGQTATYTVTANKKSRLSLTTMLATTNDAFAGLNSVMLPKKSATYYAHVYDAGSEANNESCAFIPGPPCAADSGNSRTETSEGFISISNGIHGQGDLSAQHLDWRGPAAVITIRKMD